MSDDPSTDPKIDAEHPRPPGPTPMEPGRQEGTDHDRAEPETEPAGDDDGVSTERYGDSPGAAIDAPPEDDVPEPNEPG